MTAPVFTKHLSHLPEACIDLTVLKYEFSNLIFIALSTNGKFGDMTLFDSQTPGIVGPSVVKSPDSYDSRTLLGQDKDEHHLLAKKIATELKTDKKVIVSSTLSKPISYSDATELCKSLVCS